jgi:uncharacterized protein YdeI (BOF family)
MYAGHKVQQENGQSRIQAVSSMHERAWVTLEGNVISQQQDGGTPSAIHRHHQSAHSSEGLERAALRCQDLVRVSGLVSHENGTARLDVGVIMALIYTLMQDAEP